METSLDESMDSEKAISPSKGPSETSLQQSPLGVAGLNGNDNGVGGGGAGGGGGNGGSQETPNSATNEW